MQPLYSQLPLNGHLVKADTSLKWTRGVGPCRTSVIYFISLQGGQSELVLTVSPLEGVVDLLFHSCPHSLVLTAAWHSLSPDRNCSLGTCSIIQHKERDCFAVYIQDSSSCGGTVGPSPPNPALYRAHAKSRGKTTPKLIPWSQRFFTENLWYRWCWISLPCSWQLSNVSLE